MIEKIKILLSFDLDFTLVNNQEGIIESFNYALDKFNLPRLEESEILRMIGLPLTDMFQNVTDLDSDELIYAFREYYRAKGIYQVELLPGVREKLQELKDNSFILGIITSKKQEMAEKVVELLNLKHYFDYIYGETEERKKLGKLDPILKNILTKQYPNTNIIVIGDHPKDVLLSNNLGCPFIGVLTGNHSSNELKELKEGNYLILNSIKDLTIKKVFSLI
jgi:phosphoglycolate phosphatase-like HAD superfamily hydrolase